MYTICLIPGDGIGAEVVPAAKRLLENTGLPLRIVTAEAGWAVFEKRGTSVPDATLAAVREADATLAGAFTSPSHKVQGHKGAIRYMRHELDLFANLRPAKSRPVEGCLPGLDLLMVRENTEGLYVEQERRYGDIAIADAMVSRRASERIAHVALQQARKRSKRLAVIHKANVLPLTSGLFLETVRQVATQYPDVTCRDVIVDAAAMMLVRKPTDFDVLVSTNLFGDILSDLGPACTGTLGIAPSANINPEGRFPSLFEPVHGSAPDIAGKGIANPIGQIWCGAMMLAHCGFHEAHDAILAAIEATTANGPRTPDMGGTARTTELGIAIAERVAAG